MLYIFIFNGRFSFKLNFIPGWSSTCFIPGWNSRVNRNFPSWDEFHLGLKFRLGYMLDKLTIKIQERRQWRRSGVFISKFEQVLHNVLVLLLLSLCRYLPTGLTASSLQDFWDICLFPICFALRSLQPKNYPGTR